MGLRKTHSDFQAKNDQQAWTSWLGSAWGSLQQPGAARGNIETGQMSSVATGQMSQQQSSVLSEQKTSILSQQRTSALSHQKTSRLALPALELAEFWPGTRGILRHDMVSGLPCGASPTTRSGQDDGSSTNSFK